MSKQIDKTTQSEILKQIRAKVGKKGGKAGFGEVKRRPPEHYQKMLEIRWGKSKQ